LTTELSLFSTEPPNEPVAQGRRSRIACVETLEEFVGHEQLLGPGKPLREAIEHGAIGSMAWDPGCGRPRSRGSSRATPTGVRHVQCRDRACRACARSSARPSSAAAALAAPRPLCDEIHRFNKAQQDAFYRLLKKA
jgi:putative ATPase